MKKIKDYIELDNGIFTIMKELDSDKYKTLFDDLEPASLDYDFYNMSANRYASPIISNCDNLEVVVNVILNRFYVNWLKIKNSLELDYEVLNPYFKTTTRETTGKQENESGSENKSEVSIYAFNSDDSSNKDKTLTNISSSGKIDNEETFIETVKGNNGNTLPSEMLEKEIEVRRISFINIILSDVKELLTLSIY